MTNQQEEIKLLQEQLKYAIAKLDELAERMQNGRDYLMQVSPKNLTVEDTLVAFGWNKNGFTLL